MEKCCCRSTTKYKITFKPYKSTKLSSYRNRNLSYLRHDMSKILLCLHELKVYYFYQPLHSSCLSDDESKPHSKILAEYISVQFIDVVSINKTRLFFKTKPM